MPIPATHERKIDKTARLSDQDADPVQARDGRPQSVLERDASTVVRPLLRVMDDQDDSSEDLQERVLRALSASGHSALRLVRVVVEFNDVCLMGTVPTYYLKQLAQALVLTIEDVHSLRNELEVV